MMSFELVRVDWGFLKDSCMKFIWPGVGFISEVQQSSGHEGKL